MLAELERRLVVAPMAGGPSTPALVTAASRAGAIGFLPAGYQSPEAVETAVRTVAAASVPYGLNIFVPFPPITDPGPIERYRRALAGEAERYGVELPGVRLHDDDSFAAKVELAVAFAPPFVSFTFGVPDRAVVAALRAAGVTVLITVTRAAEALAAVTAGPDALIVQSGAAGGHASTTRPAEYRGDTEVGSLVRAVRSAVDLPLVAAGGISSPAAVAEAFAAGATAVQCGTAFLLADEAGTRPAQRAAMMSGRYRDTVVTRAFTGQPARALRNRFTEQYGDIAPLGYPAIHHLTAPIRAAAAAAGDAEALNLWAGTAHASARPAPAAQIIDSLMP